MAPPSCGYRRRVKRVADRGDYLTAEGMPKWSESSERRNAWSAWLTSVFDDQLTELVTSTFSNLPWMQAMRVTDKGPTETRVLRAARAFQRDLIAMGSVSFFGVVESGAWNGRRHIHTLVTQPSREQWLLRETLARLRTKEGLVDVRPVSSIGGASSYVTKYVTKERDPFWFAGGPLWRQSVGQ